MSSRSQYASHANGRLFWSTDERFLKQFRGGNLQTRFKSFSKFPPCFKDVSFWINDDFTENNLCELVRGVAGAAPRLCEPATLLAMASLACMGCWPCVSSSRLSHRLPQHGRQCLGVRNAGDLVEEVKLIDDFTNPKSGRTSNCFRISYRSMERSLTDEEINALQERVREGLVDKLKVEVR